MERYVIRGGTSGDVLRRHGGDPIAGRKLHRYFLEAGIPEPQTTVVLRVDHMGEAKSLPLLTIDATADAIIEQGVASAEDVRAALSRLADFAADPHSLSGSPRLFQAWSRRTGDHRPAGD